MFYPRIKGEIICYLRSQKLNEASKWLQIHKIRHRALQQNTNKVHKCVWTQSIIFILSSIKCGRQYQSGFWMSSLYKFSHIWPSSAWRSTLLVCLCGNLCPLHEALQRMLCSWFTAYLTQLGLWAPLFPWLWGICVYMCAYVLENEKKKKKGWCGDG